MNPSTSWTQRLAQVAALIAVASSVVLATTSHAQTNGPRGAARAPGTSFTAADIAPNIAEIEMFVGETRVAAQVNAGRLAVGNGAVLSAAVLDDKEILLIANSPGVSSLHIWTKDGRNARIRVEVLPNDMAKLTREIVDVLIGMPNVVVKAVGDKIVVDGKDLDEEQIFKIAELARRYPQIVNFTAFQKDNPWEKMVLMDVQIVEFKKDKLRELGIKWDPSVSGPAAAVGADVLHNDYFAVNPPAGGIQNYEQVRRPVAPFQWYLGIASLLQSRINLYQRNGDAVVLADPQLAARSGKTAKFQVGGRIPYPVTTQLGQVSVQFEDFGIQVEVKPRVASNGTIHSEITAEVSEPDASINPIASVPGIRTRKAQTVFNVRNGETMVLAGLLERHQGETVERVPGLGSIPILGELFTTRHKEASESELVVFVTPRIVEPGDVALGALKAIEERARHAIQPMPANEAVGVARTPIERRADDVSRGGQ